MRHYILTRSAFAPNVPEATNRRRLELLRRVTVPSVAAQTNRDFAWIVLIDPKDPYAAQRKAAIESAGVDVIIRPADAKLVRTGGDRPQSPVWRASIDWRKGPILTTRLDDDDALVPEAIEWIRYAAEHTSARRRWVWTLPSGWRIAGQLVERVTYPVPMFSTLQAPQGDKATINDVSHLSAGRLAKLRPATQEPAWLWVRHDLTRSHQNMRRGWSTADGEMRDVTDALRSRFPIDWALVESLPQKGPPTADRYRPTDREEYER